MSALPIIRPATAADQRAIRRIVRRARINPTGLDWRRFLVAVDAERLIGTVQVRRHRDGTRELASLAVISERQGAGIARLLIGAIQASQPPPLYLTCRSPLESYYVRSGFRRVEPRNLPRAFARIYVVANVLLGLARRKIRLLVMVWHGDQPD